MVIKFQHISLIAKRVVAETPGYSSVYFERPPEFLFEAGDWMDIQFEDRNFAGGITYSLSSSPLETELRITFRDGVSEIKRALQSITGGERLFISQYGNDYNFNLKPNQASVLIAGGVGVAPFRSMIKQMSENHDSNKITLLYLNQNDNFLFKNELDDWSVELPNLSVIYINTQQFNRKKRDKHVLSFIKNVNQNFYISGPPAMVENNEHLLIDNGVQVRDIRIDSFGGY